MRTLRQEMRRGLGSLALPSVFPVLSDHYPGHDMKTSDGFLTDAQLKAELERCEYCEEKPCLAACPAGCSPADFIMAARGGAPSDFKRAAAMILSANPMGGVCGVVCPDSFCMEACSRRKFDRPIEIPAIQATIVQRAKAGGLERFEVPPWNGKKVAVVGAGPAGLAAGALLAQKGYRITIFEQQERPGGMANLIPDFRLDKDIVRSDIDFIRKLGAIDWVFDANIEQPAELAQSGMFDGVVVCAGLTEAVRLGIPGEEHALSWRDFLADSGRARVSGKRVAVLGGGAVAADCATMARRRGAVSVEIVYRRKLEHMPLTAYERNLLLSHGVEITTCARPLAIVASGGKVKGMRLARMMLPPRKAPRPENFIVNRRESPVFREFDVVVSAVGSRPRMKLSRARNIVHAGDLVLGSATVVEAVGSGKNAATRLDAYLQGGSAKNGGGRTARRCPAILAGLNRRPVPLDAEFFGRPIASPFLLSAAPHTDGYAQMRLAYERGWSGGVMKTSFARGPIHIPAGYMFVMGASTYANCDNVSGHLLDRVQGEVERLVREFPDRLTLASTGGPLTGRHEEDAAAWQSNTRRLEEAGAMGVEYSLSCPQGGDGTHGDVAGQDAELTARIIDWVMRDRRRLRAEALQAHGGRHGDRADPAGRPGGPREASRQEGRGHPRKQLPGPGVPAGRSRAHRAGRGRRAVRRGSPADQQFHARPRGRARGDHLGQRRGHGLPQRGPVPGPRAPRPCSSARSP